MSLRKLIDETRNTRSYENLKEILGKDLGTNIYKLIEEADKADHELNILHDCITELYEIDMAEQTIKNTLDKIALLQKKGKEQ